MSVKIRLSRRGAKKRPFYWIVAADSRAPRDGRFIEKLGTYNPMISRDAEDRVRVDGERVRHWLGCGAQPSDRVARLLHEKGLGAAPPRYAQTRKSVPKAKAQERAAAAVEAVEAVEAVAAAALTVTAATETTEATEATEATEPIVATESTEPTETVAVTEATESTEPTESGEVEAEGESEGTGAGIGEAKGESS
ncbi:MAG: 30S ribosomal protein S16 [Alphaproteobacteria bacterium]